MLAREDVNSYICLVLTDGDQTGLNSSATLEAASIMLYNAAINDPRFLLSFSLAYECLQKYLANNLANNK